MTKRVSRLAPSPTGALHLGNGRTFLINWALARREGWRLPLRIEDLDGPRIKAGATRGAIETLEWLGLDHDESSVQSEDLDPYRAAMRDLAKRGLVFPCSLSRREIEHAASAPHGHEHELRFGPHLRPETWTHEFGDEATNYRLLVHEETIAIRDEVLGPREFCTALEVGDFVVWTRRSLPAYQLAVVVDDARQHVSDVVRGEDLLPSAARQTLLYRAFGMPVPRWWHVPLVLGGDGRRLAKRHGDTRIASYREHGVAAERIVSLFARWSGIDDAPDEMSASDFRDRFDLSRLPRSPIVFTAEDHAWLLSSGSPRSAGSRGPF